MAPWVTWWWGGRGADGLSNGAAADVSSHKQGTQRDSQQRAPHRPLAALNPWEHHQNLEEDSTLLRDDDERVVALLARDLDVPESAWNTHMEWRRSAAILAAAVGLRAPLARRSIFGLPVMSPHHPIVVAWTGLMMAWDLVFTAFWVPLGVAFCTEDFGDIRHPCAAADIAGGCVYMLNLLISFQAGMVLRYHYKRVKVLDGLQLAYLYVRHGKFWIDALAVVPFVYVVVIMGLPGVEERHRSASWVGVLSLVRLVRLLRLISLSKVIVSNTLWGRYQDLLSRHLSITGMYMLLLAYFMAVVVNLEACIMVLIAHLEGVESSWLTSVSWEDFTAVSKPYQWYAGVYWVITTSTTTGYGDFTPRSATEQVFANIYMIIGMMLFGLLVGTVANALTRASASAAQLYQYRKKMSAVGAWLDKHDIPERTQKQVREYFSDVWVARDEASLDTEIFSDLPTALRERIAQCITMDLVIKVHVLCGQEDGLQALVAAALRPVDITPGHDICRQGEDGDRIWICASGQLQALQHQSEPCYPRTPCLLGEGLLLGDEMPAFRMRPWTLRAHGPLKLWELKLSDLHPILRMYPRLKEDLLLFVRAQLLQELGSSPSPGAHGGDGPVPGLDSAWCESVASMSAALLRQAGGVVDAAARELHAAAPEDGSLQALLNGLLEFSCVRSQRLTLVPLPAAAGVPGSSAGDGASSSCAALGAASPEDALPALPLPPLQPSGQGQQQEQRQQQVQQQQQATTQSATTPGRVANHLRGGLGGGFASPAGPASVGLGLASSSATATAASQHFSSQLLASIEMSMFRGGGSGWQQVAGGLRTSAGGRPSTQWRGGMWGSRASRPGMSTVSTVPGSAAGGPRGGAGGGGGLDATSIPVENMGQGYTMWG